MGLQIETIVIATGFTLLGAIGRLGFEIAKSSEDPGGVKLSKVATLFGGSVTSATTIAVIFLALLKAIGIQNDSTTLIGLVFCGFIGPKALIWLFQTASTTFTKRTGMSLPPIIDPAAPGTPKP